MRNSMYDNEIFIRGYLFVCKDVYTASQAEKNK
jgi:hypothetical protein